MTAAFYPPYRCLFAHHNLRSSQTCSSLWNYSHHHYHRLNSLWTLHLTSSCLPLLYRVSVVVRYQKHLSFSNDNCRNRCKCHPSREICFRLIDDSALFHPWRLLSAHSTAKGRVHSKWRQVSTRELPRWAPIRDESYFEFTPRPLVWEKTHRKGREIWRFLCIPVRSALKKGSLDWRDCYDALRGKANLGD